MRLPGSKIWRAFPELDRFSDEQCERFVLRAKQEHGWGKVWTLAGAVLLLAIAVPVLVVLMEAAWSLAERWVLRSAPGVYDAVMSTAGRAALAFAIVLACLLVLLLARDLWLRRTVSRRIRRTACAGCGYPMLGLTPDRGVVTCPECNRAFFLDDAGLSEEDLAL
ncbi:MAG TPA: hypothetical protein VD997_12085 [Phycisphaerales bacterium]|nr:hypothetical protein [Phycisphaerales bacterium]